MNSGIKKAVLSSMAIGSAIALVGCLAMFVFVYLVDFYQVKHGLLSTAFSSKWSGGCAGWNHALVSWYVAGHLAHWWAYAMIPVVLIRLHPTPKNVPTSKLTLLFMTAFIWGCGLTHLAEVGASFVPVYYFTSLLLSINGVVSLVAAVLIAWSLCVAFASVREKREALEKKFSDIDRRLCEQARE